jgi:hypothetical protein
MKNSKADENNSPFVLLGRPVSAKFVRDDKTTDETTAAKG